MEIPRQKLERAAEILRSEEVDLWVTCVRETAGGGDPVLPLILGRDVTWQSFFLVTATGERIAIVGRHDGVHPSDAWPRVETYVESPRETLRSELERLDPQRIALNYSMDDGLADGLTHGMFRRFVSYLEGTPFADRLVSSASILEQFRGHKSEDEVDRMREAIAITQTIIEQVEREVTAGWSETRVYDFVRQGMDARNVGAAWEPCPLVTTGPDSDVGHGAPSADLMVAAGQVFHIDVGVLHREYCSDLQRSWYVPEVDERDLPSDVQRAFDAVRGAIDAAFERLTPGTLGWEVDAASRRVIVEAGYDEYQHCVGHQVGRVVHDGGLLLGPRWERYGETVERRVSPRQVFTLELGVMVEGRGYLGLEDMVLVTETGAEWLSDTPRTLPLLAVR